jgi:hypothetical protein
MRPRMRPLAFYTLQLGTGDRRPSAQPSSKSSILKSGKAICPQIPLASSSVDFALFLREGIASIFCAVADDLGLRHAMPRVSAYRYKRNDSGLLRVCAAAVLLHPIIVKLGRSARHS